MYDALDRRTQERCLNGTSVVNTIDYVWGAADQLTSASGAKSAYSYTYDALGRTRTVDNAGTGGVPSIVLTATYGGWQPDWTPPSAAEWLGGVRSAAEPAASGGCWCR